MSTPYITNSEGDTYFDERLNAEPWTDATEADKTKAAKMSTKYIDRLNYLGTRTSDTQENQFPRNDDIVVPQDIKDACAELSLRLLDGVDPDLEFDNLSMVSQGYSNIRSTYDRTVKPEHIIAGIPSIIAWRLLKSYLRDPLSFDMRRES